MRVLRSARGLALLAMLLVLALVCGFDLAPRGGDHVPTAIGPPTTPQEAGTAFGTYQARKGATLTAAYVACESQVNQRYPFPASGGLPSISWRHAWTKRVDGYIAGCHQGFDHLWTRNDPARAAILANAYPKAACDSTRPTDLLLPALALPNMRRSFAPSAWGGAPLDGFGIVVPGVHVKPLSSAAVISEHLRDFGAPWSAIQTESPFNVRNPTSITTADEAITGFTSLKAEARFYAMAKPEFPPPEDRLDGRLVYDQVTTEVNGAWLPRPNELVTYSLPGSDTPTTVNVTVASGRTILGLDFEGGRAITVSEVRPYVLEAIHQVASRCGSLDIMAASHG